MSQNFQAQTIAVAGVPVAVTNAQMLAATAINPGRAPSLQIQIAGLNLDSLTITTSLDGVNYVSATLMKFASATSTIIDGTGVTGSSANAIYSILGFGGFFKVLHNGTSDTGLTVNYRVIG